MASVCSPSIPTRPPGLSGGFRSVTAPRGEGWARRRVGAPRRKPGRKAHTSGSPSGGREWLGIDSYLRIWASCRPPPPRGRRRCRPPAGPSDEAPCSPAHRDPAARTGRSILAAAAPWSRPGDERRGGEMRGGRCPRSGPGPAALAELGASD